MHPRATVIIPTFGNAPFVGWAIKSVQKQTVRDIEICVICDGSPEHMIRFLQQIAKEDGRIRVFTYPKSPRTGEPYRDIIIRQASGKIICYCSHDDLWLPDHVREMEKSLKTCPFTHSLHAIVNLPEHIKSDMELLADVYWISLKDEAIRDRMGGAENFFGLTFAAHGRESYNQLKEGWATTPDPNIPTDLYMWKKFLSTYGHRCGTVTKITALNFPQIIRKDRTEAQRDDELKLFSDKIGDRAFSRRINRLALRFCPSRYERAKRRTLGMPFRLLDFISSALRYH